MLKQIFARRAPALLLALLMICSILPAAALATETTTLTVIAPTAKDLTYSGSAQALANEGTITPPDGATTTAKLQYQAAAFDTNGEFALPSDTAWTDTIPEGTNAGTYAVYYRVVDEDASEAVTYPDDAERKDDPANAVTYYYITAAIGKATAAINETPEGKTLTANGSAQNLIDALTATGGTVQYKLEADEAWQDDVPTAKDVGTYNVYYRISLTDSTNYSVSDDNGTKYVTTTITAATTSVEVTAPAANSTTADGSAKALVTYTAPTGVTMEYSTDGSTWSTDIPTATDAGTYTIYWRATAQDGYELTGTTSGSVEVTLTAATTSVTVTAPTANNATATGSAIDLVTYTAQAGVTMEYSTDGSNYSTTVPTAADAGTYTVYWRATAQDGYTLTGTTSGSVTVTLTAKTTNVTVTAPTANNTTADGSAKALVTYSAQTGVTMEYSTDNSTWSTTIPTKTDAGTYTVYWRAAAQDGYTLTGTTSGSVTVTVSAAPKTDAAYTAPTAKTLTYNGTAQTLISAGSVTSGGTMQYSLDNKTFVTDVSKITATNAGDYTVYYKVPATDTTNEATGSVKVSIAKATITVKAKDASKTYGSTDPALSYDVTAGDSTALSGSPARDSGEDAGTYAIRKGTLATDSNHTISFTEAKFTIYQAGNEWTTEPSIAGWTYGTPNNPSGAAKYGAVTFTYSDKSDGTYTTTKPTAAGTYYMKASVAATSDYTGLSSEPQAFVIAAKSIKDSSITITVDPSKATYTGKKITPTVTIKDGSTTLTSGTDYELTGGTSGKKSGKYTITVKGKGNYSGETTVKWRIVKSTDATSPQTGDTQNPTVWIALLVAAGAALAAVIAVGVIRKKRMDE